MNMQNFLEKLLKKIKRNKTLCKWSSRSIGGSLTKLKKEILDLLRFISGNDLISMLKNLLPKNDLESLCYEYKAALRNFGYLYSNRNECKFQPYIKRKMVKCLIDSGIKNKFILI
jgi:hypothetical protein